MHTYRRLHGPAGLTLTLDAAEVYPEDPGMGTPALVEVVRGRTTANGTFWCALDTGEVDGTVDLTPHQLLWLSEQHDTVETFVQYWTESYRAK
jgi:hypothetical protein